MSKAPSWSRIDDDRFTSIRVSTFAHHRMMIRQTMSPRGLVGSQESDSGCINEGPQLNTYHMGWSACNLHEMLVRCFNFNHYY